MSLFGLFERRASIEGPYPLTSERLVELLGGAATDSGVSVSERSALKMAAVWRAVSLVSSLGGALPLHAYRVGTRERAPSRLLLNPHPELTSYDLWKLSYGHRCLWGNSYIQKVRNNAGQLVELWPISPDRVKVDRFKPDEANPSGKLFDVTDDWGVKHVKTPAEILHIPGLGYDGVTGVSPVRAAAQAVGLSLAAEQYGARLFGSGNLMSGILQTEQRLNQDQAEALKARWKAKVQGLGRSHDIAVLDSGASFQSVQMPNSDAQLIESRQFQISEVARFFGIPPFLLMATEKSTSWGTALEQQAQGFVTFDLHPTWLAPHEQRVSKELLGPSIYAKYSVEGLLRGDSKARAEFYRVMREVGAFSANDIRELEDRPPLENGSTYLQPLNLAPLGSDPNATADDGPPPSDDVEES
jgi:HK97 family phage portal protein